MNLLRPGRNVLLKQNFYSGEPCLYEEQQPWQAAADQPGGAGGEEQAEGGYEQQEREEGEQL